MTPTQTATSIKHLFDRNDVVNTAGEDVGKIEDFVIDPEKGRITCAVLSFGGGFLGRSNKLFPIPYSALRRSFTDNKFVLDVDKEVLKNAPGFDKDSWPDMNDGRWAIDLYTYYGHPPYSD